MTEQNIWDQLRGTYFHVKPSQSKLACAVCIQQETQCYFFSLPPWYQSPRGARASVWHAEYGSLAWAYSTVLILNSPHVHLRILYARHNCSVAFMLHNSCFPKVHSPGRWDLPCWSAAECELAALCLKKPQQNPNFPLLQPNPSPSSDLAHRNHAQAQHGAHFCVHEVFDIEWELSGDICQNSKFHLEEKPKSRNYKIMLVEKA